MKKPLSILIVFIMVVSLVACGSKDEPVKESDHPDVETSETKNAPVAIERDLPEGDYAELGDGTVYVSTPGGTSENGNIPVIYVSDEIMVQIGLDAWDFNGGALSFIYIDGMLVTKEQLADSQTTLTLEKDQLTEGIHTVEVVQYANDEPGSELTTYKSMQYQVKTA